MDVREELFEKLPPELQPYGVELLRRLATVHVAQAGLGALIVATLPPGSVDALVETGALSVEGTERRLTDQGRHVAALADEHEWLLDELAPEEEPTLSERQPIPAARRVQEWLLAHGDDIEDVVRPGAAAVGAAKTEKRTAAPAAGGRQVGRRQVASGASGPLRAKQTSR